MTDTQQTHGSFVWYELMTTDTPAAEAFYRAVVGWKAQDSGHPDTRYTLLKAGDRQVAGLMELPAEAAEAGARPGWTGYVGVGDVDAATARAAAAGGAVHHLPTDIPNVGRFAMVSDPQGTAFVLFTPNGEALAPLAPMTPGSVGWHELHTTDWQAAFAFYAAQFGWTRGDSLDMGPMGIYQLFATGGAPVGGMLNNTALPRPAWLYYFSVEAIDAATARIGAQGGQVLMGPHEVPGGAWTVQAKDSQGAMFALVAPRR